MSFHEHFEIDPTTGFLTPKDVTKLSNGFTAQQKMAWLEAYRESANFTKACKLVGISTSTVRDHLHGDEKFGQAYKNQQMEFNHNVEETLYNAATKSKNVTAMFGWLRANMRDKYNDNYKDTGPRKDERLKSLLDAIKQEDDKSAK
jgi:hypothetical protein